MSHTNTTTNYNLPQFVGTDKPSWLTDVNGAMTSIDTQMKANADSATSASGLAQSASTAVGDITNLNTTNKTNVVSAINEVNSNLITTANTATTAGTTATNASTAVNDLITYLSLTSYNTLTATSSTGYLTLASSTLKSAVNANGTFGRIYGKIDIVGSGNANATITLSDTGFRPSESFNVTGFAYAIINADTTYARYFNDLTLTFNTDGTVTISGLGVFAGMGGRIFMQTGLIFAEDFGD